MIQVFEVQSFGLDSGRQSFIALSITRCSQSAETYSVHVWSRFCCSGNHAAGSEAI